MEVRAWLWEHGVRQVDFDLLDLLTPTETNSTIPF
jgi:hypothetical protein